MIEKALVIVPTYNEKENVRNIISAVLGCESRADVLIVDDNSPDGTGDIVAALEAEDPRVHLMRRPGKMGLGTAYRDGFRWALARDYEYILEMDADFSHDPAHIPKFIAAAQDADFVLGSRYLDGNVTVMNWPMSRLMLSYFANAYARIVTGLTLWDATGGFKCFHRRVLEAIDLDDVRSNGYAFQIEMSFRAFRKGFKGKEIPIVFSDRAHGTSKMNRGIVREAIWMVWRLRFWALTGRL
ncbi:MAG: dolichyl-phosphate beta-D-mannosyltransferase [Gemmatimonadetes bacterium]|nr:MAG: dolichyl-phosphate beta-D-mannosyltransferase [Gemmatimonadota bacterium]